MVVAFDQVGNGRERVDQDGRQRLENFPVDPRGPGGKDASAQGGAHSIQRHFNFHRVQ